MYVGATLIESRFGATPGNLEVVARTDRAELMHFWRDTATMQWQGPLRLH